MFSPVEKLLPSLAFIVAKKPVFSRIVNKLGL